jgi:hypothetical protein
MNFVPIIFTFSENRNTSEETYHGLVIYGHTSEHSPSSNRITVSKVLKDTNIYVIICVRSIISVTLVRTECR